MIPFCPSLGLHHIRDAFMYHHDVYLIFTGPEFNSREFSRGKSLAICPNKRTILADNHPLFTLKNAFERRSGLRRQWVALLIQTCNSIDWEYSRALLFCYSLPIWIHDSASGIKACVGNTFIYNDNICQHSFDYAQNKKGTSETVGWR